MKILVAAWLGVLCMANTAEACSCVATTVASRVRESAEVFVGTVLSLKSQQRTVTIQGSKLTLSVVRARIRVEQSWKGPHRDVVEVVTNSEESMCGIEFQKGQRFLVFASMGTHDLKSTLVTGICDGSHAVHWTAESIDSLGAPVWARSGGQ